jgi:hypothetical protein
MPRQLRTGADLNNQPLTSVASPTNPTDAATKGYVDNAIAGLAWKQPVRVATTAAGTLASSFANGSTVDGVTLATGNRILIKDQATGSENGIYVVNASGAPTRATDADTTAELNSATVYVIAGTTNADKAFTQTANDPTVGTTALTWAQVGGGTAYTAGNGLALNGTTFSAVPKSGGGIVVDGTGISIDGTYAALAKRYATTLAAGGTSTAVTHNLGTTDVHVQVYDVTSTPVLVDVDVTVTSANVVTIGTASAVTTNQYRVVIVA